MTGRPSALYLCESAIASRSQPRSSASWSGTGRPLSPRSVSMNRSMLSSPMGSGRLTSGTPNSSSRNSPGDSASGQVEPELDRQRGTGHPCDVFCPGPARRDLLVPSAVRPVEGHRSNPARACTPIPIRPRMRLISRMSAGLMWGMITLIRWCFSVGRAKWAMMPRVAAQNPSVWLPL